MDILKRLNQDMANIFSGAGRTKGGELKRERCPVCKTVQSLYQVEGRNRSLLYRWTRLGLIKIIGKGCTGKSVYFLP